MKICTYHVRTLNGGAKTQLIIELKDIKWDIVGVAETKISETQKEEINGDGHTLYTSGNKDGLKKYGVGFLVNKKLKSSILDFVPVSDRICVLKCKETRSKSLK